MIIIYYNPYETFLELYRSSFSLNNSKITSWIIIKNISINLVFFLMALFFIQKSKRYIQDNVYIISIKNLKVYIKKFFSVEDFLEINKEKKIEILNINLEINKMIKLFL